MMNWKMVLAGLVVSVFLSGCTHPAELSGRNGETLDLEVETMREVEINGSSQWIYESGVSRDNPVMLWLDGGPGGSEVGWVRSYLGGLHEHYTVVCWDQRGVAKSRRAADDYKQLTVDQFVEDTISLARLLKQEYGNRKIYLVGHSWGSIIGLRAVKEAPELFKAYIGAAQQINSIENDTVSFETIRASAQRQGKEKLVKELDEYGKPPYGYTDEDGVFHPDGDAYFFILSKIYSHSPHGPAESNFNSMKMFAADEHNLLDRISILTSVIQGTKHIYPQLAFLDFEREIPSLDVPVFLVHGAYDKTTPPYIAERWLEGLQAPYKDSLMLEGSGHNAVFCEPEAFISYMNGIVQLLEE